MKTTAKQMFNDVYMDGIMSSPRGLLVKEITNYSIDVDYPFHNLIGRNDNLAYIKKEFLWYLKGDPYDDSICDEAAIWKAIKQPLYGKPLNNLTAAYSLTMGITGSVS